MVIQSSCVPGGTLLELPERIFHTFPALLGGIDLTLLVSKCVSKNRQDVGVPYTDSST